MLEEVHRFGETEVYSIVLESEPEKTRHWFRATEVSKFLGYSDTFRAVHSHCKDWQYREFQVGKGRPALYVCESGVYRLILRSKSRFAIEFQDWLTEDLLPKLRADGYYLVPESISEKLKVLEAAQGKLLAEQSQLQDQIANKDVQLLGMAQHIKEEPDRIAKAVSAVSEEEIARTVAEYTIETDDADGNPLSVSRYRREEVFALEKKLAEQQKMLGSADSMLLDKVREEVRNASDTILSRKLRTILAA